MNMVLWTISSVMIALGLFIGVSQWLAIAAVSRRKKENPECSGYSMAPLIGGLIGTIGCLLSPSPTIRSIWWIPPIIDPGCVLLFSAVIGSLVYSLFRKLFTRT